MAPQTDAMDVEPLDADLRDGAFGEVAVSDLAAAGTGDAAGFARAVVREVIVQVEFLDVGAAVDPVGFLGVFRAAECGDHERLGLAALEERAAVDDGEDADFGGERADLGHAASVGTVALLEDRLADGGADVLVKRHAEVEIEILFAVGFEVLFLELLRAEFLQLGEALFAVFLAGDEARGLDLVGDERDHGGVEIFRDEVERGLLLRTADLGGEFELGFALLLHDLVGEDHRLFERVLGAFLRLALDHDDLVRQTGVHELERALFHFLDRRVRDELAVDAADADGADRALERQVGEHKRGGRAEHGEHVALVHAVGGEQQAADLDFIEEAFREERADRAVRHAADQDLFVAGTAFALDVAAGELAGRGILLAVVDLQREEVLAFLRLAGAGGGEDDGVALTDRAGAVGEVSELAGSQREVAARSDVDFD